MEAWQNSHFYNERIIILPPIRKIPWINIYAEVNQEKEQEMIGSVGQGDSTPKITLSEFSTSKELMEKELDARVKRKSRCVTWKWDDSVRGFSDSSFRSVVSRALTHFLLSCCFQCKLPSAI